MKITVKIKACRALFCIISVMMVIFLSACNAPKMDNNKNIRFVDALGREVSVEKGCKRVAALLGSLADIWVTAGGTLCAAANDAWDDFGLEKGEALSLGGAHSPVMEQLIASEPELVLASASTASNVDMLDILTNMGITVAYFDVDSFADYLAMLDICTDITDRKDLFELNGTALKNRIDKVKQSYADGSVPENEKKILLLRASSGFVKAKGSEGTILGEMLKDMGCINIADKNGGILENLSIEAIIKEEPYHIFVVTMGDDTSAAKDSLENMISENPAWSTLDAIKENRLHVMEKNLYNLKPNARFAQAYERLYEILKEKQN